MLISIKESYKQIGILVIMACAIFVCTLLLNFNIDLYGIQDQLVSQEAITMFEAFSTMGKVTSALSGGCLCATSLLMLIFYIKNYIDEHKKEIGILKAMGYSNLKIAKSFWVFAITVFLGSLLGFIAAFMLMPKFYELQNKDHVIPEVLQQFHLELLLCLVVLPAILFAFFAIFYSHRKLHQPVLHLLKENDNVKSSKRHKNMNWKNYSFLKGLRKMTIRSRYSLSFFVFFGAFSFSSMLQMVSNIGELSSEMMAIIMFVIGVILSCTTLFLAIRVVMKGNTKTIAMMRIIGYSKKDCQEAILNGYRPLGYIGFIIGTIYQYGLIQVMTKIVFKDIDNLATVGFDWLSSILVLIAFICFYEFTIHLYAKRISSVSIKEVMSE